MEVLGDGKGDSSLWEMLVIMALYISGTSDAFGKQFSRWHVGAIQMGRKKMLGESYADRIGCLDQYFDRRISDPSNLLSSFRVHHRVADILT